MGKLLFKEKNFPTLESGLPNGFILEEGFSIYLIVAKTARM